MFKKLIPRKFEEVPIYQFPHCDSKVLHAPGECEYCDVHKDWQYLRVVWGIAFTGFEPEGKELPDPATYTRGFPIGERLGWK